MLLSFCADPVSHRSTVTFMNNDNLFNVAVTRARRRQVIFTGLDPRNLPLDHLLRRVSRLRRRLPGAGRSRRPTPTLARRLRARAGAGAARPRRLHDLARLSRSRASRWMWWRSTARRRWRSPVTATPSATAPDGRGLARYASAAQAILERAGWRVHRLSYRRWQREREQCLAEIDALLGGGGDDEETDATSA